MRRRRCFTMLLAAVLVLAITTARAMPTAVTAKAISDDASTEAVTFSDDLLTVEEQFRKETTTWHTRAPERTHSWKFLEELKSTPAAKDQESTSVVLLEDNTHTPSTPNRTPYVSTSTPVSVPLPEAPADDSYDDGLSHLSVATKWSSYSSDLPSNLETEPKVRSTGDSSRVHSDISAIPAMTKTHTVTAGTYRESVSEDAISPSTYPTTAPAKVMSELSDTGNEGTFFGGSGTTTLADVTSELSSADSFIGKEDLVSRNAKAETTERERQLRPDGPSWTYEGEPIGSGRTDRGKVPAVIVSARADEGGASSSERANPVAQQGQTGSITPALQASGEQSAPSSGISQVDHLMARAGEKPDTEKGVGGSGSPREDASKAGQNEKEPAKRASASADVGDQPRQDTPGTRNLNTDTSAAARAANAPGPSSQPGNPSGQGTGTSNKPHEDTGKLDASALAKVSQAGVPELPRAEEPKPQQGPTGNGGKGDTVRNDDAANPKSAGGLSGRAADTTDKPPEAPRNADAPTAEGTNKGSQPVSPRAEQPKATGGGSGPVADATNKSPEVPRSSDVPMGGNDKASQPESPRAEQPKATGGGSGPVADATNKSPEVPRSSDVPMGGNNKASQPESPRAEQPKATGGGSGPVDDATNKSPEGPRSSDVPMGGNNKASQPESPRAEQPKATGSGSGPVADATNKSPELPRSLDVPMGGNNKDSQPETPRAEQPKATGGGSGPVVDPKNKSPEGPRSSDVPMGGNNKASQPESPRAEEPKATGGVSGPVADATNKSPEVPRSSDCSYGRKQQS
ncbi:collagen alpha-1(II) chain-like [Dermacentor silvarum]|uniref:collagen alpha-1(II) chain-like n=1 Tax=Dermacentor silvarum TaxID=543639 RepID=UPI002100F94B|nr:collagen alpha-1(II) chain-like [Dermacentor silvarum]